MSKKFILSIIFVMILGVFSAKVVYSMSNNSLKNKNIIYFLQLGAYKNKNDLENNTRDIDNKIVLKDNNYYYVYVGISKSRHNLEKISKLYNSLGYNLYIKPIKVVNKEFLINLEQFDKLLKQSKSSDEINTINSVILSSYEEMVINSEK